MKALTKTQVAVRIRDRQLRGQRKLTKLRDAIYKFRDEDPDVFSSVPHIDSAILLLDECLKDIVADLDYWNEQAKRKTA